MPQAHPDTHPDPATRGPRGRRVLLLVLTAVAVAVVLAALLLRPWSREAAPDPAGTPAPTATLPPGYPFSAGSVWRQDVSRAPVAPNSAAQVQRVVQQVASRSGGIAAFNVHQFQVAYYTVPADQPRVDVAWTNCQKKEYTPKGLLGEGGQFRQVPIPDDAVPAEGSDGQLTIWSPETDQLWELWKAERVDGKWQACWGGRLDDVSTEQGYFHDGFGSSASGLVVAGGMVWVDDVRRGAIDHALSLQLVEARHWKSVSWPAQRSDGYDRDEDAVAEGTRLRLDPALDVDALDISPIAKMIARAAQQYGFIVTDRAGTVAISAESGTETVGEQNPWPGLMGGDRAWSVMAGFPWGELEALPVDYGKPAKKSASPTGSPSGSAGSSAPASPGGS